MVETVAKHEAAKRWVRAVNHWGQLGRWHFEACWDPQCQRRSKSASIWLRSGVSRGLCCCEQELVGAERARLRSSSAWPPEGGHADEGDGLEQVLMPGADASPVGGGGIRRS